MGKKKKDKKRKEEYLRSMERIAESKSKKDLRKDFNRIIKEIEANQYYIFETDKLKKKDKRRKINEKERDFYTGMEFIKSRKKDSKKYVTNDGLLDRLYSFVKEMIPLLKTGAKLVMVLIISVLSLDKIQRVVSPEVLNKLMTVFNVAMSV